MTEHRSHDDTSGEPISPHSLFDPAIVRQALCRCLSQTRSAPPDQESGDVRRVGRQLLTTLLFVQALVGNGEAPAGFILAIALWLWFTVLFANFAEAMAEGRGKAQADSLRRARRNSSPRSSARSSQAASTMPSGTVSSSDCDTFSVVSANQLKKGRRGPRRGRRLHSRRRRGGRGRGLGRRERDHRRKRAGHPGKRRRSQCGHRRHAGALRLAGRSRHGQSRARLSWTG